MRRKTRRLLADHRTEVVLAKLEIVVAQFYQIAEEFRARLADDPLQPKEGGR